MEEPVIDITASHLCQLNLSEIRRDTLERLEILKDSQKKKMEEARLIYEQKLNE